jgi:signal peptidase I
MRRAARRTAGRSGGLLRFFGITGAVVLAGACVGLAAGVVVLHIGIRPVLTGSMRPTFDPGSIVVTEPVPVDRLTPGMVVLFVPPGQHDVFAHRITSVSGPPGAPVITTKGDANQHPDPWHARLTAPTVPRVVASVPWIGRLLTGNRGPFQLVLIVGGGLVIGVAGTRWILRPRRPAWRTTA